MDASQVAGLPTGTVTFLFTDIEGSTQRWERNREAMQAAVRRHDEIVRSAIESASGVVFKTVGDAFYAVFDLAPQALQAAIEATRALGKLDFSEIGGLAVRMALHTGNADERAGDYFGPALNRVARLLSIGHGGQILLSGVTAALVEGQLPADASLHDLGMHRLKDLDALEHVNQLIAPDLRVDFPPLRSLNSQPNNLPLYLTSFIERDHEIGEIMRLLEQHRLVTLVGSGGIGKTRISLEVGASSLARNADGVWFVELAPVRDPALIPSTIAVALGTNPPTGSEPMASLAATLKSKKTMLILDNCEHLVAAASEAASAITRSCPTVSILASSRQPLGVAGEFSYRISTLSVPDPATAKTLAAGDVSKYGALALFIARVQAAAPRFIVTDENAPLIAEICRQLDGIALAIELAAPRVKLLSLRELRDRLNERFRVLTGGSSNVLPRQQTLRALIDWSYDLLEETERRLFTRLGIFVNGFTLEAAHAVCSFEDSDEFTVLEILSSLVDRSLVIANVDGDTARYHLQESTRAYARDKVAEYTPPQELADRHLRYFCDLFGRIQHASTRSGPQHMIAADSEIEDARAAIEWSLQSHQYVLGAELLTATDLWVRHRLIDEYLGKAETFLRFVADDDYLLRAKLWSLIQRGNFEISNPTGEREATDQIIRNARLACDSALLVRGLTLSADQLIAQKTTDFALTEALLSEADDLAGDSPILRQHVLVIRYDLEWKRENWPAAQTYAEALYKIDEGFGYTYGQGWSLYLAARIDYEQGTFSRGIERSRKALIFAEQIASHELQGQLRQILACLYVASGETGFARDEARKAILCMTALRNQNTRLANTDRAIECVALSLALDEQWASAARLAGYASGNHMDLYEIENQKASHRAHRRLFTLLTEHYDSDILDLLLDEGEALSRTDAIALALEVTRPEKPVGAPPPPMEATRPKSADVSP